jgi:hypothetical protein
MEIVSCPEPGCIAPAEVLDVWTFASTDGPLTHVKIRCLNGHILTPRREQVLPVAADASTPAHRLARPA